MKAIGLRKARSLLLCALLLFSAALPLSGAHAETVLATGYVTSKTLNVRSGPNADNTLVETLAFDDKVSVYAVSGVWLKITADKSGKSGYVSGKYITLNPDSSSAYGLGSVTGSVHLRKDATSKSESIRVLHEDEGVTVYGADGTTGWYNVSVHGTSEKGYLSPRYVKIVTKYKKSPADSGAGVITGSGVNLRSGPSKDDASLIKLSKNTDVTVLGSSGIWYKVKVTSTGKTGYVSKKYVKLKSSGSSSSPSVTGAGYINGSGVNLRKGPSKEDASLKKLAKKTAVTVIETTGLWSKIHVTSTGDTGYVFSSYVTIGTSAATPAPTPGTPAVGQAARVSGSGVNLRAQASSASASLGKLSKDTALTVLGSSGNWYKVKVTSSGTTGYVYKTYVQAIS